MLKCFTVTRCSTNNITRTKLVRSYTSRIPKFRISDLLTRSGVEAADNYIGINGYIRTIRKQKRIAFASVQDGSSINAVQVVLSPEQAAPLSTGAAVSINGRWVPSKGGAEQAFELQAHEVLNQGSHDATAYPIQKKYHTAEFLRSLPHLRSRTPFNSLLLRLRSQIIADTTAFFHSEDFVQTHTPIVTSSDCEGAGEVFSIDASQARKVGKSQPGELEHDIGPFFGEPKYLTVSHQLHLEALAQSVGKVWTLSPTFRAEKSDTARHLSEFYMLEAEMPFTSGLEHIMDVVENLIRHLTTRLVDSHISQELLKSRSEPSVSPDAQEDIEQITQTALSKRWESLRQDSWPRMTFHQACQRLTDAQNEGHVEFKLIPDRESGLQTEHERYLADTLFCGPIFITDYPQAVKPFYMASSGADVLAESAVPTVACFDLLLPEVCEVAGGSMREHSFESLRNNMRDHGLLEDDHAEHDATRVPSPLDWYLDLRRYGSVPHGGFGLGFDRLLGFLAGVKNIRDVVTFPRYYKHCLC